MVSRMTSRTSSTSVDVSPEYANQLQLRLLFEIRGTDIPCCLVFVLALGALVAMLVYGAIYGDAKKLNHGLDGQGSAA